MTSNLKNLNNLNLLNLLTCHAMPCHAMPCHAMPCRIFMYIIIMFVYNNKLDSHAVKDCKPPHKLMIVFRVLHPDRRIRIILEAVLMLVRIE